VHHASGNLHNAKRSVHHAKLYYYIAKNGTNHAKKILNRAGSRPHHAAVTSELPTEPHGISGPPGLSLLHSTGMPVSAPRCREGR
jgi:hypothetical protein